MSCVQSSPVASLISTSPLNPSASHPSAPGPQTLNPGYLKNLVHKDAFTGREGEFLKFVSSALPPKDAPENGESRSQLKK